MAGRNMNWELDLFNTQAKPLFLPAFQSRSESAAWGLFTPESTSANYLSLCLLFWEVALP